MSGNQSRFLRSQRLPEHIKYFRSGLCRAVGLDGGDLEKPIVGVIHAWNEMGPGDFHLKQVAGFIKASIRSAGGTPVEVVVPGLCAGMSNGTEFSSYSLPYRDFAAAMVEIMLQEYICDGAVVVPTCDYTVPAYLMGIARVNIPSIVVTGGYMQPGEYEGHPVVMTDVKIAYGKYKTGKMSELDLQMLASNVCPSPGACPILGTANTMCVITEAIGMSLPGTAATPANSARLASNAKAAGAQVMKLIQRNTRPSDIMTKEAFENAIMATLAMGGSTNAVVHLIALAKEMEIKLDLNAWDQLSRRTPFICSLMPNHPYNTMREFDRAGGVQTLMKELQQLLHMDTLTVTGNSLRDNLLQTRVQDRGIIRPFDDPIDPQGGLAVLRGSLAPEGSIAKVSAFPTSMLTHKGPARVFDSEKEAFTELMGGKIKAGDVMVIRYEGPRGGPGAPEPVSVMHGLIGMGLGDSVALVSDSRVSGTNKGAFIAHVSPEAAAGGPIAIVRNDDLIEIDVPARQVNLKLSDEDIENRLRNWSRPKSGKLKGALALYARLASSLSEGGGISLE
jgi:dihydroxy-acid dehydratase